MAALEHEKQKQHTALVHLEKLRQRLMGHVRSPGSVLLSVLGSLLGGRFFVTSHRLLFNSPSLLLLGLPDMPLGPTNKS
ncbi:hypothetical protein HPB52_003281 [Rhipicephalus sanguineus]|uniref:Uncharacterized protein n=1 Tax=Rhipicephalus sanguineus TaxID=34632 RepID=A0A9D4T8K3_RHISA|nr:hypothetical protein HPB52_003281 [Rhipicephalus sanguineus]